MPLVPVPMPMLKQHCLNSVQHSPFLAMALTPKVRQLATHVSPRQQSWTLPRVPML